MRKLKIGRQKKKKLKQKKSVTKRFEFTGTGDRSKVRGNQANKRHNMRKRSKRQLREQRGTVVMTRVESKRIAMFMPYGGC